MLKNVKDVPIMPIMIVLMTNANVSLAMIGWKNNSSVKKFNKNQLFQKNLLNPLTKFLKSLIINNLNLQNK